MSESTEVKVPDALRQAFMTADSGQDKYQVVIRFNSLKDMQAAHEYLVKHLGHRRSAGSVS